MLKKDFNAEIKLVGLVHVARSSKIFDCDEKEGFLHIKRSLGGI
jgi:hypothetical protein